jgi:hypothetical protein
MRAIAWRLAGLPASMRHVSREKENAGVRENAGVKGNCRNYYDYMFPHSLEFV